MTRTTLYENTHVLIDALLDPAGGLTLRCLTTGKGMADGYHVVLTIDETQALRTLLTGPPPALVSHAELTQRMAQAIDHRDEALAAQHGERLTLHEARARARKIAEDAEAERQADLQRDWPDTARNGTSAARTTSHLEGCLAQDTVLDHCMAADIRRQGVAVETEIRALLAKHRIPADSPYGDWSSELAKHEPQRWPDTTAQDGPGRHAGQGK